MTFRRASSLILLLTACGSAQAPDSAASAGGGAVGTAGSAASAGASTAGTPGSSGSSASGGATGGSAAAGTSPGGDGGAPASGTFKLLYRDDFDQLDSTRWQIMTHSWDTNLALFSDQAVSVQDGQLAIKLLPAPAGTVDDGGVAKPYFGAEVRSIDTLTYGRVRTRAKLGGGSAVVSSLVTIYTPWPADNWNELDVECLGKDPSQVQFNAQVYTGPPVQAPVTKSVSPTQDPRKEALGFDASQDYHIYTVEWTPAGASFSVDDQVRFTWTKNIKLMTLPQNVLLTIWASSTASWAGPANDTTTMASATYDWIELYRYAAP